jgi:hypothetical protein
VNHQRFNQQHVIALLKHLQNVDPIQLSLQLLAETLQLNNAKQDAEEHQLNQLEEYHHHIKELQFL